MSRSFFRAFEARPREALLSEVGRASLTAIRENVSGFVLFERRLSCFPFVAGVRGRVPCGTFRDVSATVMVREYVCCQAAWGLMHHLGAAIQGVSLDRTYLALQHLGEALCGLPYAGRMPTCLAPFSEPLVAPIPRSFLKRSRAGFTGCDKGERDKKCSFELTMSCPPFVADGP